MHKKLVHKAESLIRFFLCVFLILSICVISISVYLTVSEDTSDSKDNMQIDTDTALDDHATENSVLESVTSSIKVPPVSGDTEMNWTSLTVEEKLEFLEGRFPSGKYWNHRDMQVSGDTSLCVSGVPCDHSQNGYVFCNQYQGAMRDLFSDFSGIQCFGYASLLSDLLFGTDAPISEHQDIERIRVGDHIRFLYAEHSVIVTEIGRDENDMVYVYVTECNSDYENCSISWGRRITQDELTNIWVCTRYLD